MYVLSTPTTGGGMLCKCGGITVVIETRKLYAGVRRRRECTRCGERFTTEEKVLTRQKLPPPKKKETKLTPYEEVAKVKEILVKQRDARNANEDRFQNDDWIVDTFKDIWRSDNE